MNKSMLLRALTWAKQESTKTNSLPGIAVRALIDEIKRLYQYEEDYQRHKDVMDDLGAHIAKHGQIDLRNWQRLTHKLSTGDRSEHTLN